jgi:hypothetical protein
LSRGTPPPGAPVDPRRSLGDDGQPAWRSRELRVLTASLLATIAVGTTFYQIVEGWSALDAMYFCVVTLATVGYGDFTPKTPLGKVFTMGYIVVGIGLLAGFVQAVARRWVDRRIRRISQNQAPVAPKPPTARQGPRGRMARVRRARRHTRPDAATAPPPVETAGTPSPAP